MEGGKGEQGNSDGTAREGRRQERWRRYVENSVLRESSISCL